MMRRALVRSNRWASRFAACAAATACLAGAGALHADGGVTFTNISAGGAAGVQYQRIETPALIAQQLNYYNGIPLPHPGLLSQTPQKPHGAPGVVLFDYDNDGDMDIYVTNGPGGANSLFQNQFAQTGQVTFVDVAVPAGVAAVAQNSTGVCYGDLDNDGFEDLYVLGLGENNILFHNNGNGTFSDITAAAGVAGGTFHHASCAMGDFNNDGYLDIAVADTYDDWSNRRPVVVPGGYAGGEPNLLFMRNPALPGIQFTDASVSSGVQASSPAGRSTLTWGISAVDVDQDGNVDLLWADLQGTPPRSATDVRGYTRWLKNDGTGHFTDVTLQANLTWGSWMGLAYGDFNCDGNMDFVATNLGNYVGGPTQPTRWFLGDGHGGFTDPGVGALNATPFGWGVAVVDYDNDGDQDIIYYGDDDLLTIIAEDNPGTVLQNTGGCHANFTYDGSALTYDHRTREVNGVAAGDLNNDGFPDVVSVAMFQIQRVPGFNPSFLLVSIPYNSVFDSIAQIEIAMHVVAGGPTGTMLAFVPTQFTRGDVAVEINSGGNGNGAVSVKTLGSFGLTAGAKVNRDGMGAVLKFTPDGGNTVITPVLGGGSHASQSSRVAGFGLGTAAQGTVDVLWPGGVRNRLYDVKNGESVVVPEIPCSYAGSWKNFGQYNACVHHAINDLRQQNVITEAQGDRLAASAARAFPGQHDGN